MVGPRTLALTRLVKVLFAAEPIDVEKLHNLLNGVGEGGVGPGLVPAPGEKQRHRVIACVADDERTGIARRAKVAVLSSDLDLVPEAGMEPLDLTSFHALIFHGNAGVQGADDPLG